MEVSILCGQEIQLVLYDDNKKKLVVYQSSDSFTTKKIEKIRQNMGGNQYFEHYDNNQY